MSPQLSGLVRMRMDILNQKYAASVPTLGLEFVAGVAAFTAYGRDTRRKMMRFLFGRSKNHRKCHFSAAGKIEIQYRRYMEKKHAWCSQEVGGRSLRGIAWHTHHFCLAALPLMSNNTHRVRGSPAGGHQPSSRLHRAWRVHPEPNSQQPSPASSGAHATAWPSIHEGPACVLEVS